VCVTAGSLVFCTSPSLFFSLSVCKLSYAYTLTHLDCNVRVVLLLYQILRFELFVRMRHGVTR